MSLRVTFYAMKLTSWNDIWLKLCFFGRPLSGADIFLGFPKKHWGFASFHNSHAFKRRHERKWGLRLASWARQPIGSIRISVVSFAFSWVPSLGQKIPKDGCFEWSIFKTRFMSNNERVHFSFHSSPFFGSSDALNFFSENYKFLLLDFIFVFLERL